MRVQLFQIMAGGGREPYLIRVLCEWGEGAVEIECEQRTGAEAISQGGAARDAKDGTAAG
jgi:hypothetical protein